MDLSTTYMGLKLKNPLVGASSPISKHLDQAKRLEDAGASALVMYSLFEEQVNHEKQELDHFLFEGTESYAEALNYLPEPTEFHDIDGQSYLDQLRSLKKSLSIPVIASLNGVSHGGWMRYAKFCEDAGADAIELNVYYMATPMGLSGETVEQVYIDSLKAVKAAVKIPVAMKVGPYFSAFANMAHKLDAAGADALVLFNRFFGPNIDLDTLEVKPQLNLSTPWEMRLPLRWVAVLHGNVKASLAATSGIKTARDVVEMIMAGADVAMVASVLLERGVGYAKEIVTGIQQWMEAHEYESVRQMKGSMSYKSVKEPAVYERVNYMRTLNSYR